jgi:Reverse transcriptase (RNA-dependent DNA polymerase).
VLEHNIDMHNILVNYTQAFDSVYRNKIIECLPQYNFPAKLIKLIELTLIDTRTRVMINSESAEEFKVESGVKQGDPLSATLFSVVVDAILKQLDLRGNISTHLKQYSVYAGDILVNKKQSFIDTFQKLKNPSVHFGLIVISKILNI